MNLKQLEMTLERLSGFEHPRIGLEQYGTPPTVAARLLFHAYMRGDIEDKRVCDLGCGTGILACGAALLGADACGVDIDPHAIVTARQNARLLGVDVQFFEGDIRDSGLAQRMGFCDTVVMNPPFGAQKKAADRPFIDRALSCGSVIYGIFNAGSLDFLRAYTGDRARIDEVISGEFPLKRTFPHHIRDRVTIRVEIVRMIRM
jgi:putative methylase